MKVSVCYKYIILSVLFLYTFCASAQTIQQGKVVLQNSGHKTLSGTQITAYGAQPTDADSEGRFKLHFDKANFGDITPIREAYKKGYELVNKKELDRWVLSNNKNMIIVMAPANKLKEAREKYYNVGNSSYLNRYQKSLIEIERLKEKQKLTETEYSDKLEAAYNELSNSQKLLADYADLFSRVNKDELNEMERQAFSLLETGNLDEAIALYENQKLLEQIAKNISRKESLSTEIKDLILSLKRYAEICVFAGGKANLDKAIQIYEAIAKSDMSNFDNLYEYAILLQKRIEYPESIEWMTKALAAAQNKQNIAKAYAGLGETSRFNKGFNDSENYLNQAISIYDALAKDENDVQFAIADTYAKLSYLYLDMKAVEKGQEAIQKALKANSLSAIGGDTITLLANRAELLGIGGMLSHEQWIYNSFQFDSVAVENAFIESIDIYTRLVAMDSSRFISQLSLMERNLGAYYHSFSGIHDLSGIKEAEEHVLKSLHWEELLSKTNPYLTEPKIGLIYNSLGTIYARANNPSRALEFYNKSFEIRKKLAKYNPNAFRSTLFTSYINIGEAHEVIGESEKAIAFYLEALELLNSLSPENQKALLSNSTLLYSFIGDFYKKRAEYDEAEKYYKEAEKLIESNPEINFQNALFSITSALEYIYLYTNHPDWNKYFRLKNELIFTSLKNDITDEKLIVICYGEAKKHLENKRYDLVEKHYDEALTYIRHTPKDSLNFISAYNLTKEIGQYYLHKEDYEKALSAFLMFDSLQTLPPKKSAEEKHLTTYSYYLGNIASAYTYLGKQNEINEIYRIGKFYLFDPSKKDPDIKGIADYIKSTQKDDYTIIYMGYTTGNKKLQAGDTIVATRYFEECLRQLEILEKEKGKKANLDIPTVYHICNSIGEFYMGQNDKKTAMKLYSVFDRLIQPPSLTSSNQEEIAAHGLVLLVLARGQLDDGNINGLKRTQSRGIAYWKYLSDAGYKIDALLNKINRTLEKQ